MGCGGSKDILLNSPDLPLDYWMESLDMESLDNQLKNAENIIITVEEKRRAIVDDLETIYSKTGAIAFKTRDLEKALKCAVWRLGVDNEGKVSEIGFNAETQNFEGKKNSEEGNNAANSLVHYCKNFIEKWKIEDLTDLLKSIEEIKNDMINKWDVYMKEIIQKNGRNPSDGFKKIAKLENNNSKCLDAIICLKDIIELFRIFIETAPQILAALNQETMLKEATHVEKAFKHKLIHPVKIAWNLIEKLEDRQGKNCNDCQREYSAKIKARNDLIAKYAKQQK